MMPFAPAKGITIKETNVSFSSWSSSIPQMSGAVLSCSLVDGLCCTVTPLTWVQTLSSGMHGVAVCNLGEEDGTA